MKIFVTRHGQVADNAEYLGDVAFPKGDIPLSRLGCEQARLLGERLRSEGFSGVIYSSPFLRTMQTADIIARMTGSTVVPTPAFHEIFRSDSMISEFEGKSSEELKALFPEVVKEGDLPEHWWTEKTEDAEAVRYRVSLALEDIMQNATGDVLLVGHGASVDAMLTFLTSGINHTPFYNCSYTVFDTATKRCIRNDSAHLTTDKITYNRVPFMEKEYKIDLPEALASENGPRILHIGDTHSLTYPWYISLVKQIKPDVIIHTGDTADEMKVSRDIPIRELYLDRATAFLTRLTELCPRVIWVEGNNDLPERITALVPKIEHHSPGTVLEIEGVKISLAHQKKDLADGSEINLYGHSGRYEVWSRERNTDLHTPWYLNAIWGVSILSLPQKKLFTLEHP